MDNNLNDKQIRAQVLAEALPYIQDYNGKIVVIKYGGNAMINEDLKRSVMHDIVLLNLIGVKVVLVHGGGPEISEMLKKTGKESVFIDGLRYTDKETAEIVRMVLAGKINKSLVDLIEHIGGRAVGLCGIDGHMMKCEMADKKLGFVGKITNIDTKIVTDALDLGYIPVVSTVGYDDEGNIYNVNADTAAAVIAGALDAQSLILMTDTKGVLRNKEDESSLIDKICVSDIPSLVKQGIISGGMIPKIDCCKEAIRRGVEKVFIIDGRIAHSILVEILSDQGIGTMFVKGD
ncbi:MAG TPA: acetylglutamate kinase [Candidatus Borkfalkia excrementavium]|uniref:Acetylglutamate kinase n=1 Tax=Candidatus Borkfalkia excrementavium TaxID=2838505 RepID=A0A9D1Z7P2_9FIRM|nr:acetylglutamate kinase [Candidatus Borkfalkia excrementavium]